MIRISASAGNPAGAGGQHCGEIDSGAFAEELSAGIEQSVTTIARLAETLTTARERGLVPEGDATILTGTRVLRSTLERLSAELAREHYSGRGGAAPRAPARLAPLAAVPDAPSAHASPPTGDTRPLPSEAAPSLEDGDEAKARDARGARGSAVGLDPAAAAAGEDADDAWLRDQLHGFWRRFLPPRVSTSEKYLQASFERIDADNSGVVTVAEMRESLVETGAMSAGEARMLCLAVDRDGDGEVTYDEFKLAALASGLLGARRRLGVRERVYVTLDDPASSGLARALSLAIIGLIVLSVLGLVLESEWMVLPGGRCAVCYHPESGEPDHAGCELALGSADACMARCGADRDGDGALDCAPRLDPRFWGFECVAIPVFTLEYALRLLTVHAAACVDAEKMIAGDALSRERASAWRVGARRTWDFATSPLELFDLLAVLPFWLELAVRLGLVAVRKDGATASLSALRLLRLTRVTRVFKLGKQAEAFRMFVRVIARSTPALRALAVFILLLMSLFGSLVYAAERGEWRCSHDYPAGEYMRPTVDGRADEPSPFRSISFSFWWVLVTATTVGFGDLYPTTTFGKVIGTFTMLSGVLVLALPITIVGSNFAHEYEKKSRLSKVYAQSLKKEKARRGVNVGRAIRRKLTGRTSPGAKAESEPVVRRRHTRLLSRRRHSSVHASYTTGE